MPEIPETMDQVNILWIFALCILITPCEMQEKIIQVNILIVQITSCTWNFKLKASSMSALKTISCPFENASIVDIIHIHGCLLPETLYPQFLHKWCLLVIRVKVKEFIQSITKYYKY